MSVWCHDHLLYGLNSSTTIIHFVTQVVPTLAVMSSFKLLPCPFNKPTFLSISLIQGITRCSRLILYSPCPSPGIKDFSKKKKKIPGSFYQRIVLKNKGSGAHCYWGFTKRTSTTNICFLMKLITWKSLASPGSSSEPQILGSHPRLTRPESLRVWCRNLRFNKFTR